MASEGSSLKAVDKVKFKGYWKKLTSFNFVLHMLFFDALINPLASLSCHVQGSSADLLFALAKLEAFHMSLPWLKTDDPEKPTKFLKFIASFSSDGDVHMPTFHGVKLRGASPAVLQAFQKSRSKYIDLVSNCVKGRFDDLQQKDVFKGARLLDIMSWPTEKDAVVMFGHAEVSLLTDHFKPLLLKRKYSPDGIITEWSSFKLYWLDNLQNVTISGLCFCHTTMRSFLILYIWWRYSLCFPSALPRLNEVLAQ